MESPFFEEIIHRYFLKFYFKNSLQFRNVLKVLNKIKLQRKLRNMPLGIWKLNMLKRYHHKLMEKEVLQKKYGKY